jgi:ATP-dependent Clp protease ATP-binding subunit ClpA
VRNLRYEDAAKLRDQAENLREGIEGLQRKWRARRQELCGPNEPAKKSSLEERYTDRARKVMARANLEAQQFNHEYIGTEHILLGLVQVDGGVAASVLKSFKVDLQGVRQEVEKLVNRGPERGSGFQLPKTPRARQVIKFAIEEAERFDHNYVGTEHILLGLLREHDGVGAQVLMNFGLKLDGVREEVLKTFADDAVKKLERREALVSYLGMFLGWLNNPHDPVARILVDMNVDLDEFRRRVRRLIDDNKRPE